MADNGNTAGTVLVAFTLGALAGAAVALLLAPATGEETREILARKAREGREAAEKVAREGRDFVNRQRENLNVAVERGREAFHEARGENL